MVSAFDELNTRVDFTICGLFQARNSLSVASVQTERPISDASSRSLLSVASARPKSSESTAVTGTANSDGNSNGNSNGNASLVGGVVGGVLSAIVLFLIILLYWRNRRPPPIGRRPFIGQQPSSQPITPASLTFSMNSNDIGGFPVTNAAQPGWRPQQLGPLTLSGGPHAAGQTSTASQQYTSTRPNKLIQRAPDTQQNNYGGPAFQSLPAVGSVDPRGSYDITLRGPTHYAAAPVTAPYAAPDAFEGAPSPPPRYCTAPPVSEKAGRLRVMNTGII